MERYTVERLYRPHSVRVSDDLFHDRLCIPLLDDDNLRFYHLPVVEIAGNLGSKAFSMREKAYTCDGICENANPTRQAYLVARF